MSKNERWQLIPGFDDRYKVSDLGRVRSFHRYKAGKVLKARVSRQGYLAVDLYLDYDRKTKTVHSLVAEAFLGPRPRGKQVAHRDGDGQNAALSNLRYATPKENDADKIGHGSRTNGERHGNAKLTDAAVREIRLRCRRGEPQRSIALSFGVNQCLISRVSTGKRWGHLR